MRSGTDVIDEGPLKPAEMLRRTLWFALATGLIEQLYLISSRNRLFFAFNPDSVWMVLLVDLLWVGLPGLLFTAVAWRFPRRVLPRTLNFALALFAWTAVVLLLNRLHTIAAGILAVGLAVTTARVAAAWPRVLESVIRRTTPWLALTAVGLAVIAPGARWWRERQAYEALGQVASNHPNVLLLLIDTGRASHLSLYGYERPTTPWLEQWARQGVVFDHAIAPASWTLPSHAAFFTGRYPTTLIPKRVSPLDDTYPTLAEALEQEGYVTGAFFANVEFGHPLFGLGRGFVHHNVFGTSIGEIVLSSSIGRYLHLSSIVRRLTGYQDLIARRRASGINASFLRWLSSTEGRPFFAFLNYYDAHLPYLPPREFAERFDSGRQRNFDMFQRDHRSVWVPFESSVSREEYAAHVDAYDGAIAYLDEQIRLLLGELRRMNTLDNTVVIITSDHGESFGEHEHADHGRSLFEPEIHVPLIIWYPPSVPAGARIRDAVSLQDIPVTVLTLIDAPNRAGLPGKTLTRFWDFDEGTDRFTDPVLTQLRSWDDRLVLDAVILGNTKYIRTTDRQGELQEEQVFRLDQDPDEEHNLLETAEGQTILPRLRSTLDSLLDIGGRLTSQRAGATVATKKRSPTARNP